MSDNHADEVGITKVQDPPVCSKVGFFTKVQDLWHTMFSPIVASTDEIEEVADQLGKLDDIGVAGKDTEKGWLFLLYQVYFRLPCILRGIPPKFKEELTYMLGFEDMKRLAEDFQKDHNNNTLVCSLLMALSIAVLAVVPSFSKENVLWTPGVDATGLLMILSTGLFSTSFFHSILLVKFFRDAKDEDFTLLFRYVWASGGLPEASLFLGATTFLAGLCSFCFAFYKPWIAIAGSATIVVLYIHTCIIVPFIRNLVFKCALDNVKKLKKDKDFASVVDGLKDGTVRDRLKRLLR